VQNAIFDARTAGFRLNVIKMTEFAVIGGMGWGSEAIYSSKRRHRNTAGGEMRYYFNLEASDLVIPDQDGVELDGPDQAWLHALKALEQISQEDPDLYRDGRGWTFKVVDESGAVVFSLLLCKRSA
jgi:hypothetical protein